MPLPVDPELQSSVLLCIDDDADVLECEKSFLETFGYTVLTAESGGKGLELASMHSVDLVKMRRLRPQAPIIMLSAVSSSFVELIVFS